MNIRGKYFDYKAHLKNRVPFLLKKIFRKLENLTNKIKKFAGNTTDYLPSFFVLAFASKKEINI